MNVARITQDDVAAFEQVSKALSSAALELADLIERMRRKEDIDRVHELRLVAGQLTNVRRALESAL